MFKYIYTYMFIIYVYININMYIIYVCMCPNIDDVYFLRNKVDQKYIYIAIYYLGGLEY